MPRTAASKKDKPPKDLNAPKKPLSGYLIFSNERRPKLAEETGKRITELSKIIAGEWKQLTATDKKPWEEKAKIAKEEYQKKSEEYKKNRFI